MSMAAAGDLCKGPEQPRRVVFVVCKTWIYAVLVRAKLVDVDVVPVDVKRG